jgi:hypothetical protein
MLKDSEIFEEIKTQFIQTFPERQEELRYIKRNDYTAVFLKEKVFFYSNEFQMWYYDLQKTFFIPKKIYGWVFLLEQ